jgi:hypothetical protein
VSVHKDDLEKAEAGYAAHVEQLQAIIRVQAESIGLARALQAPKAEAG